MTHSLELLSICDRATNKKSLAQFVTGYDQVRGDAPLPHFESYMLHESTIDLLDNAILFEPRGEGEFIYRFCGSAVVARSGADLTGMNLIKLWPESEQGPLYRHLMTLVHTPCGNFAKIEQVFASGAIVRGESLTLPVLSEKNPTGVFLLACTLMDQASLSELEPDDYVEDIRWRASFFVDVGHGVPAAAPAEYNRAAS